MKKILVILISLLLIPSYSYAGKWHTNMKKQEKKDFANYVLRAQSKNKMVFTIRNVPNRPCLLYTSPSPRDLSTSRMPSSA